MVGARHAAPWYRTNLPRKHRVGWQTNTVAPAVAGRFGEREVSGRWLAVTPRFETQPAPRRRALVHIQNRRGGPALPPDH
jgi:hypothetical protein